jgi:glycosyltransferase involved in cell wall biosynthesis
MNKDFGGITHYCPGSPNGLTAFLFPPDFYKKLFFQHPPSAVLLVSWHPMNFIFLHLIKVRYPKIPVIIWLHEPYKDEKKVYKLKATIIYLVEFFQTLSLHYVDVAILHSNRALRLFDKRYPKFKGLKKMIPLPFRDDGLDRTMVRRYISFLGRADQAKGIELFFELVQSVATETEDWLFQIVTASNIQPYLEKLSPQARLRLSVINKGQISDGDLREAASRSLAVLALYKETTQSGFIPVALMKGAPVIGTNIEGITECIRDGETGIIVSAKPSLDEIRTAIEYINKNFIEMSSRCRLYYLSTIDDQNWEQQYGWLREFVQIKM